MSTTYHTPIPVGAPANAATFNSPLGELDAAIVALAGGGLTTDKDLLAWTEGEAWQATAVTYDATYPTVPVSATIKWPDGSAGVFTATTINTTWQAVDAYTLTHADSGRTVTQAAVTRGSHGQIVSKPALSIS